jgi:pyridoxamine 5'-phosphate oxidase
MNIDEMRKDYEHSYLERSDLLENPFEFFKQWWNDALKSGNPEPNVMTLATATVDAKPSARIVLLKGIEGKSFVFYTSYISRKAEELAKNPQASLLFFWPEIERQVRIEGVIRKISEDRSTAYFQSRPRGSQIGAWVSQQSHPIDSREAMNTKWKEIEQNHVNQDVLPKPPYWGGYELFPDKIEFWQGRPNRLHDRFVYTKNGDVWGIMRLQP